MTGGMERDGHVSESREERCLWCAGDEGPLITIEVPVDTEIPAGEPTLEEVAVHPHHASEAREYCFAFARYALRDLLIVILWPVFLVAAVPLGQMLSVLGGSEHAWRAGVLCLLLVLHGSYVVRFPYTLTPRWPSMKIGGLRKGRRIVRFVGMTVALIGAALALLVFA